MKKLDRPLALVFAGLTVAFIGAMFASEALMEWAFARHHNTASWYIRPLFLIPLCWFAGYGRKESNCA